MEYLPWSSLLQGVLPHITIAKKNSRELALQIADQFQPLAEARKRFRLDDRVDQPHRKLQIFAFGRQRFAGQLDDLGVVTLL